MVPWVKFPLPVKENGPQDQIPTEFEVTENFGENRFPAQAEGILTHSPKKLRFSMLFALVERVCESPFSLTGRGFFSHARPT